MENLPKISVIIPTYNYADYIGAALAGVLGQKRPAACNPVGPDALPDERSDKRQREVRTDRPEQLGQPGLAGYTTRSSRPSISGIPSSSGRPGGLDTAWPEERLEIIVVDDASTDNTAQVIENIRSFLNKRRACKNGGPGSAPGLACAETIKYIRAPKGGVSAARNIGLAEATGDYLLFLDADDILLPGYFAAQHRWLCAHPEFDAAVGLNERVFSLTADRFFFSLGPWRMRAAALDLHLMFMNIAPPHSIMLRRSRLPQTLRFDTAMTGAEDYDFWFNCLRAGLRFGCNREAGVLYRFHPASASRNVGRMLRHDCVMLGRVREYLDSLDAGSALRYGGQIAHLAACLTVIRKGLAHAPEAALTCAADYLPGAAAAFMALELRPGMEWNGRYADAAAYYLQLIGKLTGILQKSRGQKLLPELQELFARINEFAVRLPLPAITPEKTFSETGAVEADCSDIDPAARIFVRQRYRMPWMIARQLKEFNGVLPSSGGFSFFKAVRSLVQFVFWITRYVWREKRSAR